MEYDSKTKTAALIVACSASFTTPFIGSATNVALPAIEKTFAIDAVALSWVATIYLLSTAIFLVPFGRAADIYGRKKFMAMGFTVFALASLVCATSISYLMLLIGRVLQGMGGGMIFSTGLAIISSVFPPRERGKAIGVYVSSVYIGLSSGPFIGGILTQHLTWRSLFFVVFVMAVGVVGMIHWRLKGEWAEARGEKFDLPGTLIYAVTLIAIIYGLSILPAFNSLWIMAVGVAGLIIFVNWEIRTEYPVLQINLFRSNRVFALSNLAALIHYSATFAITFLLSLYLQYAKGLSPQTAGLILMAQPITMAIVSPLSGRFSDRFEPRFIASSGMAITGAMLVALSRLHEDSSLGLIIALLIILGLGLALFSSPNMNAIMSSVEKRYLGIASGANGTMRVLGQMFSMGIATLVISLFIGRVQITTEVHGDLVKSASITFIIFAALCLIGLFCSMVRGNVRR